MQGAMRVCPPLFLPAPLAPTHLALPCPAPPPPLPNCTTSPPGDQGEAGAEAAGGHRGGAVGAALTGGCACGGAPAACCVVVGCMAAARPPPCSCCNTATSPLHGSLSCCCRHPPPPPLAAGQRPGLRVCRHRVRRRRAVAGRPPPLAGEPLQLWSVWARLDLRNHARTAPQAIAWCGAEAPLRHPRLLPPRQVGFAASFASKLADTTSSEIGKAYGRTTYLVTSLQRVPRGTEGAVSAEGTAAGVAAAAAVAGMALALGQVREGGREFGRASRAAEPLGLAQGQQHLLQVHVPPTRPPRPAGGRPRRAGGDGGRRPGQPV